jgi:hypothetical protein
VTDGNASCIGKYYSIKPNCGFKVKSVLFWPSWVWQKAAGAGAAAAAAASAGEGKSLIVVEG